MLLLKQLEFGFRTSTIDSAVVEQAPRLPNSNTTTGPVALRPRNGRDPGLEARARALLWSVSAARLGRNIHVQWNSRLRTCAGRADFRKKLISLNPRLLDHSAAEIDRTLRHELAHLLAQFRAGRSRILPHGAEWRDACRDLGIAGEVRCHSLPFPVKTYAPRFVYRCPNCFLDFPRVHRVRRAVACLACCRIHNGGDFDPRFRLTLVSDIGGARAIVPLK